MRARLGDIIDDYCVKCKRIMNHSVVSCLNDEAAKVRCRTCHGDHDYRHEQAPPTKADLRKAQLFKEVLERMGGGAAVVGSDGAGDIGGNEPASAAAPKSPLLDTDNGASAEVATPAKTKRAKTPARK